MTSVVQDEKIDMVEKSIQYCDVERNHGSDADVPKLLLSEELLLREDKLVLRKAQQAAGTHYSYT